MSSIKNVSECFKKKNTRIKCYCESSYYYRNGEGTTKHNNSIKHKKFDAKYIELMNESEEGVPELYSEIVIYCKNVEVYSTAVPNTRNIENAMCYIKEELNGWFTESD